MERDGVLEILRQYKEAVSQKYGIISLGMFGSIAREESTEQSDVDVVVNLRKQDLFNLVGIKQDLEDQLHASVDVISYREKMNPFLKKRIDKEAVYV